jgi:hypothetical protein
MDKIARYQQLVEDILREYGSYKPLGDVEVEIITDAAKGHYQLMTVGWHGQQRIHGCQMHVDIRGGKIWIQHDGTEEGIANRLVEAGVPREDIVLGFHTPFMRKFTDFAVN